MPALLRISSLLSTLLDPMTVPVKPALASLALIEVLSMASGMMAFDVNNTDDLPRER